MAKFHPGIERALQLQGGGKVRPTIIPVNGVATGVIANVLRYVPVGGTVETVNPLAGVTIASNGNASVVSAIGAGVDVSGVIRCVNGTQKAEFALTLRGQAVVPAAPTLNAVAGNGQISLSWTDGSNGGAAITGHKLYMSDVAGFTPGPDSLVGTITTASPYVVAGLPNGQARYFRLSAINSVGESGLSAQASATPAATLDLPTGVIQHWKADDLAQANLSNIVDWPARVGGTSMTVPTNGAGATPPVYVTNALGGKPAVRFTNRRGALSMGADGTAILRAALLNGAKATGVTQVFIVKSANVSSAVAILAGWEGQNDSLRNITCSIYSVGYRGTARVMAQQGGLSVIVIRRSSIISNGAAGGAHFGLNGNSVPFGEITPLNFNYLIGNDGVASTAQPYDGDRGYQGDFFEYITFGKALTKAEEIRVVKRAHLEYGQPIPWSLTEPYFIVDGNSYTAYPNGPTYGQDTWHAKLCANKAVPFGNTSLFGISSRSATQMRAAVAANYGPGSVGTLLEELGVPGLIVMGQEFANTPEQPAQQDFIGWGADLKALIPRVKIGAWTPWDNGAGSGNRLTNRPAAITATKGAVAPSGPFDRIIAIDEDASMGAEGACPLFPGPYGNFFVDDAGHPSATGSPNGTSHAATFAGPTFDQLRTLALAA